MTTTRRIKAGTTDVSVVIRIIDSTDGTPETGVVFNTSGIDLEYRRELEASTDITEATLAALTTAHADGGFLHIGNGYYRLDLPDAACAVGATGVLVHGIVTGMVVIGTYIELVAYDPYDTVRLGLTALPNAVVNAANGLYTRGTGAGQINQPANGLIDVNVENWNTTAVPAENTAGYPIVTIKDGTGAGELDTTSGLVLANVTQLGGSTQSATDLKDFADDGYDPSTNKVQGVVLTDTVTTYTGNTLQTGDSFARLGAPAGASVSADIAAIEAQTDDIGAAGAGLTALVDLVWDELIAGHAGVGSTGAALSAAGGSGDPWSTALPGAYGAGTAGKIIGDNVNATISSRATPAQVNTEVDTALADARLDELLAADSDIDGAAPPTVGSVFHELLTKTAGSFTFDQSTDSLEALRDNLSTATALATAQTDLDDIQTRLPTALVGGRIDSNVGAISSDAVAADNAEAFFDGTGYAGTNNVIPLVTNVTTVNGLAAGVITPAAIATDAIDSDAIAANAITEIQNGLATAAALTTLTNYVDTEIGTLQTDVSAILADTGTDGVVVAVASKTGYALSDAGVDAIFDELRAGHSVAGSYGESFFTLESGAAIAGTLSTTQMSTNLTEGTDDHYKGRIIIWVSGVLLRQATDITAYNGTTKVLTFTALTEAPTAADKFIIV